VYLEYFLIKFTYIQSVNVIIQEYADDTNGTEIKCRSIGGAKSELHNTGCKIPREIPKTKSTSLIIRKRK